MTLRTLSTKDTQSLMLQLLISINTQTKAGGECYQTINQIKTHQTANINKGVMHKTHHQTSILITLFPTQLICTTLKLIPICTHLK
jgi:hypothetical protein